ncbi:hypothetical protein BDW67DRAFT_179237 [Aspergillus spinulosporus]
MYAEERRSTVEASASFIGQDAAAEAPSQNHLPSAHKLILVAAILVSNLSTAVDSSLSASAHVAVASAFNRTSLSSWPVNAFLLMSTTFQPLYARVSDYLGRRIPYLTASALFLGANAHLRSINGRRFSSSQASLHNYDWRGSVLLIMYHTTLFFQSVFLESPQQASMHLIIPSISFTIISAITASLIAKQNTPAYTLRASKILLTIGTLGLFVAAALTSARSRMQGAVYNLILVFPTLGVGMMAPSVVLTLLNSCTREDHAVSNGCFIMMRSLGVFTAAALGTTTLQNSFEGSISRERGLQEQEREMIEASRQQVELVPTLPGSVRSKVIDAYSTGFTILFGLCFLLALLIVLSLRGIRVRELDDEPYGKQIPSEMDTEGEEGSTLELNGVRR